MVVSWRCPYCGQDMRDNGSDEYGAEFVISSSGLKTRKKKQYFHKTCYERTTIEYAKEMASARPSR